MGRGLQRLLRELFRIDADRKYCGAGLAVARDDDAVDNDASLLSSYPASAGIG
jgi:hypothetical protein